RELGPQSALALGRLVDAGLPVMNQSVLLRGVNDRVETLEALFRGLVAARVRPTTSCRPIPCAAPHICARRWVEGSS
ncbi:MAG: hypothetical protein OEY14_05510, partial [Myxococcales bacterium]|nr:hypothetical protein [Myxococcales bacterium]